MREVESILESVFREQWSRIVATLIRISGSFDLAEEAAQEAFATALKSWPASDHQGRTPQDHRPHSQDQSSR
jgi:predicted RNA polymerase sigma factor